MPERCSTTHPCPERPAGVDVPRAEDVRRALTEIAHRVTRVSLLSAGTVEQLPQPARAAALQRLEELDGVATSLRAVIVELAATG